MPIVMLAPMSGVTDLPFRRQVRRFFDVPMVSEMLAGRELVARRPDVVRRARADMTLKPNIMQIAGTDPHWMAEGARIAESEGAEVVDINMGCPAKHVAKKQSGCALMRDPDLAIRIMRAVVAAVSVPVTLKLRLGWTRAGRNAPFLARAAESEGVTRVTVHGRAREDFFKGHAEWPLIGEVVDSVSVAVTAMGDIVDRDSPRRARRACGAAGVMIGRAALGRPWLLGDIRAGFDPARHWSAPSLTEQAESLDRQLSDSLSLYGEGVGLRNMRKHIAAWIDAAVDAGDLPPSARHQRKDVCRLTAPDALRAAIHALASGAPEPLAA